MGRTAHGGYVMTIRQNGRCWIIVHVSNHLFVASVGIGRIHRQNSEIPPENMSTIKTEARKLDIATWLG
jgi:hypothetical protein